MTPTPDDQRGLSTEAAIEKRIAEAVAAEREACAKIAEEPYGDQVQAYGYDEPQAVGRKIAAAIRARSKGEK